MSTLKTVTSALTAVALVTGIGFAVAQTEDQPQQQPTDSMAAAPATTPSEQTPADPNAVAPVDGTMTAQQQPAVDDPNRTTPPADTTAPLPSASTTPATPSTTTDNTTATTTDTTTSSASTAPSSTYEPKPRRDRN